MLWKKKTIVCCMLAVTVILLLKMQTVIYADYEGTDFIIVVDVSGSMMDTDKQRYSIETIKAVIDLCRDEDRIGVVAYNDEIVYTSQLIELYDEDVKDKLKEEVNEIAFSGETDIGLGIAETVSLLEQREQSERKAVVIVLSDGETDLENSNTGRTVDDSDADVESGMRYFMDYGIKVHTIGFRNGYSGNMSQLSLLSTATDGSSMIVSDPFQLMVNVTEIIHDYQWEASKDNQETPEQTTIPTPEPIPSNQPPKATGTKDFTVYVGDEIVYYDLNILFKDEDSLTYTLMNSDEVKKNITLDGSVLKITPVQAGDFCITIQAEDELGELAEVELKLECLPDWKKYETYIIIGVVVGIVLIAVVICVLIIYFMGRQKRYETTYKFSGVLYGSFIDLKSKNERPDIKWELQQYSDAGVSLQELFLYVKMQEDLPQLERLCFYPSSNNDILLVHCMDGGVFVDNRNISANVPAKVSCGETIYISFADNASELALRYESGKQVSGLENL